MPPKKQPIAEGTPTFRQAADDAAAKAQAERDEQLKILQAEVGGETPAPAAAVAPPENEETYEKWFEKQPEKFRAQFAENVVSHQAQKLAEFYGPEISGIMQEVAQDPELKKRLARLSDKQLREWLLDTAAGIYDGYAPGGTAQPAGEDSALSGRLEKLESRLEKDEQERANQAYIAERRTEYEALLNTFPELKWSDQNSPAYKRAAAVLDQAENESRSTGRKVSYADTYTKMRDMWEWQAKNPPPPHAPAAQASAVPPSPQAPRNKIESKAAIKSQLDKYGSLSALQAALKR